MKDIFFPVSIRALTSKAIYQRVNQSSAHNLPSDSPVSVTSWEPDLMGGGGAFPSTSSIKSRLSHYYSFSHISGFVHGCILLNISLVQKQN